MALLEVENLTFMYPGTETAAVRDVSFQVRRGEMLALCGLTGSGKSTLLRLLKREISPLGHRTGSVLLDGVPLDELPERDSAFRIGYVMQRPEEQIVTDKVWHELAFGLENGKVPREGIMRRIAEMAAYFDIEDWFEKPVHQLSGGQKQLLTLAAVMVMQPELLILDEPTAQLDPIAASEFIATVRKLNRETGLTVILAEHRLEEAVPLCDRLMVLDEGKLLALDEPRKVITGLKARLELLNAMPAAARLYHQLGEVGKCPLDVREGRELVETGYHHSIRSLPETGKTPRADAALQFEDVYFRYERNAPDVLRGLSFTVYEGEICCILGGNGSGKTTTLSVAAGLNRPYSGRVKLFSRNLREYKNQSLYRECLAMLPQDVQTVFLENTVGEELKNAQAGLDLLPFDLTSLFDRHPYDLSGGQQQLVALARVLAAKPRLLLLDEPTKGMDASAKEKLTKVLRSLKAQGMTILVVTHDVEFAANCADRCAMFFRGEVVSQGDPREFFSENCFYTTAASRMTRGWYDRVVTVEDAAELCRRNGRKGGKE